MNTAKPALSAYEVWEIFSYAWTEIGIDDDECLSLMKAAGINAANLDQVDRIYFRDVCASFAVDSFLIVPMMLWFIMPDWGYNSKYLKERHDRWYAKSYALHFLNPIRVLGYPIALVFSWSGRKRVRRLVSKIA